MANVRNYEEYRAEVLDTLGATVEDLRNEPSFRAKVLETLGVEYTDEDTRNFERYRLKALEGLKNGGGGTKYETVFEGNVTTETSGNETRAIIQGYDLTADTIKVTFNGTEYVCEKQEDGGEIFYGDSDGSFSEYPFAIAPQNNLLLILAPTAGTYSLKIEEPQSGGGSGSGDLSTAEVTVINTRNEPVFIRGAFACDENELWEGSSNLSCYGVSFQKNTTTSFRLVLYKGMSLIETDMTPISTSGSIQELDLNLYTVTGDCTITFGGVD